MSIQSSLQIVAEEMDKATEQQIFDVSQTLKFVLDYFAGPGLVGNMTAKSWEEAAAEVMEDFAQWLVRNTMEEE